METIHRIQKKVIRILFGDLEAYKLKFMTCARTRSLENQILGEEFFRREHTKPLFREQNILTVQNLYSLHCFMETFKILKFHSPISLYNQYTFSNRSSLTYTSLLPPKPGSHFFHKSSTLWNIIRGKFKINDLSLSTNSIKERLKLAIHKNQHTHHDTEWIPTWLWYLQGLMLILSNFAPLTSVLKSFLIVYRSHRFWNNPVLLYTNKFMIGLLRLPCCIFVDVIFIFNECQNFELHVVF